MTGGFEMRRFWEAADIAEVPGGWAVRLDGRTVRTPDKAELIAPTRALAQALAAEWDAQGEKVDPTQMHLTRAVNVAIDRIAAAQGEVTDLLLSYGETDLLCYRAEAPDALVARQAAAWDPWLAWVDTSLNAPLRAAVGVMPTEQPGPSLAALRQSIAAHDCFEVVGLHDLVTITGSLVLGLAISRRELTAEAAWPLSRVDEIWQVEQWGADEEAAETAALKHAALLRAEQLLELLRTP